MSYKGLLQKQIDRLPAKKSDIIPYISMMLFIAVLAIVIIFGK